MKNTILIIEDEKPISDIVKFNLEREGYDIITAFDGVPTSRLMRVQRKPLR